MESDDKDYFVYDEGDVKGPYNKYQLEKMWDQGLITSKAICSYENSDSWTPVKNMINTNSLPDFSGASPNMKPVKSEKPEKWSAWQWAIWAGIFALLAQQTLPRLISQIM